MAKRIRIVEDGVTVTGEHASLSEVAHEADAVTKMLVLALLNQYGDKVLVGLEHDALASTQIDFKDMLLFGGLRMRESES